MGIRSNLSWSSLQALLTTLATAHIFKINYLRIQKKSQNTIFQLRIRESGLGPPRALRRRSVVPFGRRALDAMGEEPRPRSRRAATDSQGNLPFIERVAYFPP